MFAKAPAIGDSVSIQYGGGADQYGGGAEEHWTWAIDTVIPMREADAQGTGKDRRDCMRQFRAAWDRFSSDPGRLTEFLEMKRKRLR